MIGNTHSAKEVLEASINSKLKYLDVNVADVAEIYGPDPTHYPKKIAELKVDKKELLDFLSKIDQKNN